MTIDEQILWDYVDEESNDLVLETIEKVENDGFDAMMFGGLGTEELALKVLSAAMIKVIAMMGEKRGDSNLAMGYLNVAPMHAELVKTLVLKQMRMGA